MTLAQQYARGLFEAGVGKDVSEADRLVESLVALLKRKGHLSLRPAIAREYRRLSMLEGEKGRARVVLAREQDAAKFRNEIAEELAAISMTGESRQEYDGTLVGGYRIEHKDTVVDASYKTQLLSLYRKMLST